MSAYNLIGNSLVALAEDRRSGGGLGPRPGFSDLGHLNRADFVVGFVS